MNVVTKQLRIAGLHTAFQERVQVYQVPGLEAAMHVPSTVRVENYAWLGDVSQFEEWKDEIVPRGLEEFTYSLRNKRFGTAIKVYNDDLSDELYGQTLARIQDIAEKGKVFPSILVSQARANGETELCYDGSNFHSTTHQSGSSGVQSNIVTGTGTSVAQIRADLITARARLFSFKTDKGDVFMRANPRLVAFVPATLEIPVREAAMLSTVSTGGQNVLHGLISDVVVDQTLTGNSWYLEDLAPRVKPYIHQEREALTLVNTNEGSDTNVLHDATVFRGKSRGNVGYALWQHSIKIKNS